MDLTSDFFYQLFDRCYSQNMKGSVEQHVKYFNFLSKVQLDHPVVLEVAVKMNRTEQNEPLLSAP